MLLATCDPGLPSAAELSREQLRLMNQDLDALHEEVVAARAPSQWPFVLFLGSILLPLAAAMWLLSQAQRSVIGADETIRTLLHCGLSDPVIRHYLAQHAPRRRLAGPVLPRGSQRPATRPRRRRGRRRRRRRGRADGDHGDAGRAMPRIGPTPDGVVAAQDRPVLLDISARTRLETDGRPRTPGTHQIPSIQGGQNMRTIGMSMLLLACASSAFGSEIRYLDTHRSVFVEMLDGDGNSVSAEQWSTDQVGAFHGSGDASYPGLGSLRSQQDSSLSPNGITASGTLLTQAQFITDSYGHLEVDNTLDVSFRVVRVPGETPPQVPPIRIAGYMFGEGGTAGENQSFAGHFLVSLERDDGLIFRTEEWFPHPHEHPDTDFDISGLDPGYLYRLTVQQHHEMYVFPTMAGDSGGSGGFGITVNLLPEPSTLTMLLLAASGGLGRRRRMQSRV